MKWGVKKLHTWELPRVELVEINVGDDGDGKGCRRSFSLEVVNDEFFVGGVEAKAWREVWVLRAWRWIGAVHDTDIVYLCDAFSLEKSSGEMEKDWEREVGWMCVKFWYAWWLKKNGMRMVFLREEIVWHVVWGPWNEKENGEGGVQEIKGSRV